MQIEFDYALFAGLLLPALAVLAFIVRGAQLRTNWRIPALWAVVGGVVSYLAIASAGVGASPTFADVGNPHDPQPNFLSVRAARHRLVGLAGGGVGLAAGLVLLRLRSRWAGAVVGGLAGAAISFGPNWDIGQPPGVPGALAASCLMPLSVLGLLFGFVSVRRPSRAEPAGESDRGGM